MNDLAVKKTWLFGWIGFERADGATFFQVVGVFSYTRIGCVSLADLFGFDVYRRADNRFWFMGIKWQSS